VNKPAPTPHPTLFIEISVEAGILSYSIEIGGFQVPRYLVFFAALLLSSFFPACRVCSPSTIRRS
jgi:hypothetical protein